jgi:hypothetical protein
VSGYFVSRHGKDVVNSHCVRTARAPMAHCSAAGNPSPSPHQFITSSQRSLTPYGGMDVMTSSYLPILKHLNRFLPVVGLCVGLLLIVPPAARAQGMLGGPAGELTSPLRSYLSAKIGRCGGSDSVSLGVLSAGYQYYRYTAGDGINVSELRLRYALPLIIGNGGTAVTGFAMAHITDLSDSQSTASGLAQDALRFGTSWRSRVCGRTFLGARGEYDATKRGGTWYSGGQVAGEMFTFVCNRNVASLKVTYYGESAGNQLIFPKNASGYELSGWYGHEIIPAGARLLLILSGYDFDTGLPDRQRGWMLEGGLSGPSGWLSLKGGIGHDSILLNTYSVGASINVPF